VHRTLASARSVAAAIARCARPGAVGQRLVRTGNVQPHHVHQRTTSRRTAYIARTLVEELQILAVVSRCLLSEVDFGWTGWVGWGCKLHFDLLYIPFLRRGYMGKLKCNFAPQPVQPPQPLRFHSTISVSTKQSGMSPRQRSNW
jgi:hypothetical protein